MICTALSMHPDFEIVVKYSGLVLHVHKAVIRRAGAFDTMLTFRLVPIDVAEVAGAVAKLALLDAFVAVWFGHRRVAWTQAASQGTPS